MHGLDAIAVAKITVFIAYLFYMNSDGILPCVHCTSEIVVSTNFRKDNL